jgi:hypothetical protein
VIFFSCHFVSLAKSFRAVAMAYSWYSCSLVIVPLTLTWNPLYSAYSWLVPFPSCVNGKLAFKVLLEPGHKIVILFFGYIKKV